jgi:hypothetical protein
MTGERDAKRGTGREDRLKSALRENLKRRKLQARERALQDEPSTNDHGPRDQDAAGKPGG